MGDDLYKVIPRGGGGLKVETDHFDSKTHKLFTV